MIPRGYNSRSWRVARPRRYGISRPLEQPGVARVEERWRVWLLAAGARSAVEESLQIAKNEVGTDQYQVCRYDAWYAHITLAMTAAAFLTIIRAAERAENKPLITVTKTA